MTESEEIFAAVSVWYQHSVATAKITLFLFIVTHALIRHIISNSTRGELPRPSSWMEQRADDRLYFSPSPQDWNLTSTMPASPEHDNHSGDERAGIHLFAGQLQSVVYHRTGNTYTNYCSCIERSCVFQHTLLCYLPYILYFITAGLRTYSTAYFIVGLDMGLCRIFGRWSNASNSPSLRCRSWPSFMELVLGGYRGRKRLVALRRCGYLAGLVTTAALMRW